MGGLPEFDWSTLTIFFNYIGAKPISTSDLDHAISSGPGKDGCHKDIVEKDLDMDFLKNVQLKSKSIIKIPSGEKWFDHSHSLHATEKSTHSTKEDITSTTKLNKYWLEKIEQYAEKLYLKEMENFVNLNSVKNVSSEKAWIDMVLKSGTLPDKMSAFTVLLQDDPIHNLPSLESLVNMVNLKSRRPCMLALDALRDLFCNHLLPKDRKLLSFPIGQQEILVDLID